MFMKMNTFIIGAAFFSDPLIWRGLDWLNKNYPNWQKLLEIEKYVTMFQNLLDQANSSIAHF